MSLVRKLADHVFVLHNGSLLAEGSVAADPGQRRGPGGLCRGREMSSGRGSRSSGLAGGYGDVVVVRDIAGAVAAGEVLCVIGRNGVGKSTLLKLLFGQLPCRAGSVRFDGRAIDAVESAATARARHQLLPAGAAGVRRPERARQPDADARRSQPGARSRRCFARFPILERRLEQHAGTLSGGEKKILSFVRGLSEAQPLILLDEPSEGVQWENIVHMAALIDAAKGGGPRLRRRRAEPRVRRARSPTAISSSSRAGRARGQARRDRSPDAARAPAGLAASSRRLSRAAAGASSGRRGRPASAGSGRPGRRFPRPARRPSRGR